MKYRNLMLAMASCIFAASCSKEESVILPQNEGDVVFTASMKTVARATETSFEEGDKIGVYAVETQENTASQLLSNGNYADNVCYTYTGGKFINQQGIVRPTDRGLRYYAIYPYTTSCGANFKFGVKTNQNTTGQYTLSDLCTAVTDVTTDKEVDLVFSHRLSHVIINLEGKALGTGTATVELNNVNTGCDVDLNANTFTAYESRNTVVCADNGTNSYKAIIVPQTIEAGNILLTITLNGKEHVFKATSDIRFASGKQQVFNLVIEKDEIVSFTGEILPWGEEEEEQQKVGIYSLDDLVAFRDARNAGEDVSQWKNEKGEINIYADIDMSSIENWEPISKIESNETLNGLGHKLSRLSMSIDNGTTLTSVGLVAITYGTIKNLHLGEGCIKINDTTSIKCVGAISGQGYDFVIQYCSSQVDIETKNVSFGTGGICGLSHGGYFNECENRGNIKSFGNVCGVVGQLCSLNEDYPSVLENCANYGIVESNFLAAGIARSGNANQKISNCINYGKITSSRDCAGIGIADTIANCINEGVVNGGNGDDWPHAGGITTSLTSNDVLINCINRGSISGLKLFCGGIAGSISFGYIGTYDNNKNEGFVNGEPGSEENAIGIDYR